MFGGSRKKGLTLCGREEGETLLCCSWFASRLLASTTVSSARRGRSVYSSPTTLVVITVIVWGTCTKSLHGRDIVGEEIGGSAGCFLCSAREDQSSSERTPFPPHSAFHFVLLYTKEWLVFLITLLSFLPGRVAGF